MTNTCMGSVSQVDINLLHHHKSSIFRIYLHLWKKEIGCFAQFCSSFGQAFHPSLKILQNFYNPITINYPRCPL